MPPPRVRPASPVCVTIPAGTARPCGLRRRVELAEEGAGLRRGPCSRRGRGRSRSSAAGRRRARRRRPMAGKAVAAAAHRDRQLAPPGEGDRRGNVAGVRATGDQRRRAVDRPVPDGAVLVVGRVARSDELAANRRLELAERLRSRVTCGARSPRRRSYRPRAPAERTRAARGRLSERKPAATYSPRRLRTKYHRR